MEATARYRPNGLDICLADDDLNEDRNDDYEMNGDEENVNPSKFSVISETKTTGVMKTKLKDRRSLMKRQGSSRRRRRSSARFLKIASCEDEDGDKNGTSTTNLGEVYRNAIRMNAENRINASNSWNLNLIDHLDRFVAPEPQHRAVDRLQEANGGRTFNKSDMHKMDSTVDSTLVSGVNFTKASCTLDASVKIYSYRVDDVHLTSYKVLANLNRTDNNNSNGNGKKRTNDSESSGQHSTNDDEEESSSRTKSRASANAVDTLELNSANINIHKLDAAFDIDPLFHKMSKTFDEGGAKGLLLANLGVGYSGCNIVFDSTLENNDHVNNSLTMVDKVDHMNKGKLQENIERREQPNSAVKVSSLINKLESLLCDTPDKYSTIEKVPLVPQLSALREQYADLGKDGYVEETGVSSKRYASSLKDEAEADKSIHLEAIERSRVSQADLGRSSRVSLGSFDSDGDHNYGGSGFDFDGNDDDVFGDVHDGEHRYSSSSFAPARASFSSFADNANTVLDDKGNASPKPVYSQAIALLDAIASGDISTEPQNQYEYFNSQALKNLSSGNVWAGAEHWRKMPYRRRQDGANLKICNKSRSSNNGPSSKKKGAKGQTNPSSIGRTASLVSISAPISGLEGLLQKPKRGRAKNTTDPLQLTKAMRSKYTNIDNLLPLDAGLGVHEFVKLFSRPNENLIDFVKAKSDGKIRSSTKVVGFGGVETLDTDDGSGAGFDFGGSDDVYDEHDDLDQFVVPILDDVRKVDKINIGYARVARKVDVKRLKRDLWSELEQTFAKQGNGTDEAPQSNPGTEDPDDSSIVSHSDEDHTSPSSSVEDLGEKNDEKVVTADCVTSLSFQDTVRDMQINQSQADVTLPFYFICILHLCNEKGLALESSGLDDFVIHNP